MRVAVCAATVAVLYPVAATAQDSAMKSSTRHDGTWYVSLVCASLDSKSGPIKGYEFSFKADVSSGRLEAQHGQPGSMNSLALAGLVRDDGTLTIDASGVTGDAAFSVGRVSAGTRYAYTMAGKLGDSSGEATRLDGRPCTATFNRRQ